MSKEPSSEQKICTEMRDYGTTLANAMLEIHGPNGEVWAVTDDGTLVGFPDGSEIKLRPYLDPIAYPVDLQLD